MTKTLVLGLACFILAGPIAAQSPVKQRLDSFFDVLAAKNLAMSSIAISKNGKIFYRRSLGQARTGEPGGEAPKGEPSGAAPKGEPEAKPGEKPANANTEYRIGSISNLFTATLVFQLIEEKRLHLDDKLSAYFPDLPNAKQITIANLLDHRSGLHDFTKGTNFDNWKDGAVLCAAEPTHHPPAGTAANLLCPAAGADPIRSRVLSLFRRQMESGQSSVAG